MARDIPAWPAYFYDGKKPLVGTRKTIMPGDLLEVQTKEYARAIAAQAGVKDAATRPMGELGCIKVVNVRSARMAAQIAQQGLNAAAAQKLVEAA